MTHTKDTIPYGYCHCGCGRKTNICTHNNRNRGHVKGEPLQYVRGHSRRLTYRTTLSCVICGTPFTIKNALVGWKTACDSPACRRERRRRASTGIDRKGEWREVTCACGCGTIYDIPMYKYTRCKSKTFWFSVQHRRDFGERRRQAAGKNVTGVSRYGHDWTHIVRRIRKRDKVCQDCGKTPKENRRALDVHHIEPFRAGGSNDPSNLIALCRSCHTKRTVREELPPLPIRRAIYQKHCIICGASYTTTMNRVNTCSPECRMERQKRDGRASYRRKVARVGKFWVHQKTPTS